MTFEQHSPVKTFAYSIADSALTGVVTLLVTLEPSTVVSHRHGRAGERTGSVLLPRTRIGEVP